MPDVIANKLDHLLILTSGTEQYLLTCTNKKYKFLLTTTLTISGTEKLSVAGTERSDRNAGGTGLRDELRPGPCTPAGGTIPQVCDQGYHRQPEGSNCPEGEKPLPGSTGRVFLGQ